MWIKQAVVERLIAERAEMNGVNIALERMVEAQKATVEFMAMRLQQVEHERALLTEKFLGISLPVPVVKTMPGPEQHLTAADLLNALPNFDDMGDEAAASQGISWDKDGRVIYTQKA
jgi:hypothetical protein